MGNLFSKEKKIEDKNTEDKNIGDDSEEDLYFFIMLHLWENFGF